MVLELNSIKFFRVSKLYVSVGTVEELGLLTVTKPSLVTEDVQRFIIRYISNFFNFSSIKSVSK